MFSLHSAGSFCPIKAGVTNPIGPPEGFPWALYQRIYKINIKDVEIIPPGKVRNTAAQVNISPPALVSLGHMEDGTALGDVELPPWAKGDPQEFIRIHREVSEP